MSYVKVPGIDRRIWVDLHEPTESDEPWFADAGTRVDLTPEQFAAEMASPHGFNHTATTLAVTQPGREGLARMAQNANAYEIARRSLIRGRKGSPRQVLGFQKAEDFALIVLYFESRGYRQASSRALKHWVVSGQKPPTRRHTNEALQRVRNWLIEDIFKVAELARKRWGINPIPTTVPTRRRQRVN